MRKAQLSVLFALAVLLTALVGTALSERVERDGVAYDVQDGVAYFAEFVEGADTVTIHDAIDGAKVDYSRVDFFPETQAKKLIIEEGVTSIPDRFLSYIPQVETLLLPSSLTVITESAFSYCPTLRELIIPEGVVEIENYAFDSLASLERVSLPSTLQKIGDQVFSQCEKLAAFELQPDNKAFRLIGGALYSKDGRRLVRYPVPSMEMDLVLPEGTTEINADAFITNDTIRSVRVPEGVTSLPSSVFEACRSLKELYLPASLSTLEEYALSAYNGTRFFVAEGNPKFYTIDGVFFGRDENELLLFSRGHREAYAVPPGTRKLADYAFSGDDNLKSVSIPSGVTEIPQGAFSSCTSLEAVSIPLTVTKIGEYAFGICIALERVALPPYLTEIGEYAFQDCHRLREVRVPESVAKMGKGAFQNDVSITNVIGSARIAALVEESNFAALIEDSSYLIAVEETGGTLGLYETASETSALFGKYPNGTVVFSKDYVGEWYEVVIGEKEGFMRQESLQYVYSFNQFSPEKGMVKEARAPLYKRPLAEGEPLLTLNKGDSVTILGGFGPWYKVQSGDTNGFMPVRLIRAEMADAGESERYGVVANPKDSERLHLRDKPSTGGASLGRFFNGTQVKILGQEGDWYRVDTLDGEGYMMVKFIDLVEMVKE